MPPDFFEKYAQARARLKASPDYQRRRRQELLHLVVMILVGLPLMFLMFRLLRWMEWGFGISVLVAAAVGFTAHILVAGHLSKASYLDILTSLVGLAVGLPLAGLLVWMGWNVRISAFIAFLAWGAIKLTLAKHLASRAP